MAPTLDQINLVVQDMEATSEFYRRLGIQIDPPPAEWASHHRSRERDDGVSIDFDSQHFASVWNAGWPGGSGVVLGFRVDTPEDVDRLYSELTTAGQTPYDAFWGARYAIVADPDGNSVGLMSQSDPSRRQPPPALPPR